MIYLNIPRKLLFIILALTLASLAGCNLPGDISGAPTLNVTQAYQTVAARLTQAIAQTPSATITPTATQGNSVETSPSPTVQPSRTPTIQAATSTNSNVTCDQAAFTLDVTVPMAPKCSPVKNSPRSGACRMRAAAPGRPTMIWFISLGTN